MFYFDVSGLILIIRAKNNDPVNQIWTYMQVWC